MLDASLVGLGRARLANGQHLTRVDVEAIGFRIWALRATAWRHANILFGHNSPSCRPPSTIDHPPTSYPIGNQRQPPLLLHCSPFMSVTPTYDAAHYTHKCYISKLLRDPAPLSWATYESISNETCNVHIARHPIGPRSRYLDASKVGVACPRRRIRRRVAVSIG